MLFKNMIVNKDINRKVLKDFFFIKGSIDIDSEYFIDQIKKSCSSEDNLNYRTNIKGLMTPFKFFKKDCRFLEILSFLIDYVDENYELPNYTLKDAWGFEVRPREKTILHSHSESCWSGVIYLNECNQVLNFPEIGQEVKPQKGAFALFSPFLTHGCNKNKDTNSKFGLSFNFQEVKN